MKQGWQTPWQRARCLLAQEACGRRANASEWICRLQPEENGFVIKMNLPESLARTSDGKMMARRQKWQPGKHGESQQRGERKS